jgi:large subunit ribosomal protein L17
MRHLRAGRKLNRSAAHRRALKANLATSILEKERVTTTLTKAKEIRTTVDRLITFGKKGGLHAVRLAARIIKNEDVLKKLFDDIAPFYKDRNGGYTRIVKLAFRKGDNADTAIIELVARKGEEPRKKPKSKQPAARKKQQSGRGQVSAEKQEQISEAQPGATEVSTVAGIESNVSVVSDIKSEDKAA